jgi:hypothetical protein
MIIERPLQRRTGVGTQHVVYQDREVGLERPAVAGRVTPAHHVRELVQAHPLALARPASVAGRDLDHPAVFLLAA